MKEHRMGHYCRICGCIKPNEKFSGKGHRNHICKKCARRPKKEIEEIEQEQEIYNFLSQSHISKKNIASLNTLKESEKRRISEYASIVLEVAKARPYKKRRLKILSRENRPLLKRLRDTGLIMPHYY